MSIEENSQKSNPSPSGKPLEVNTSILEEDFAIVEEGKGQFPIKQSLFILVFIILVAIASCGLGKLSKLEMARTPVVIQEKKESHTTQSEETTPKESIKMEQSSVAAVAATKPIGPESVVASKNGKKYHFPWCSGAKRISEGNKVVFDSPNEARKAGYTPAANCKGLK